MEEPLNCLAKDSGGEQAKRIYFVIAGLHSAKMHHAARETGVILVENQAIGFNYIDPLKDSRCVRRHNACAKAERFHRSEVVHQDLSVLGKEQPAVSEIVEDRIDVVSRINENEIESAAFRDQRRQNRGRSAGTQCDEIFQLWKTPTPNLFDGAGLRAVFTVDQDRPMLPCPGRDDVHRHQFRSVLEGSDLVRHAKNAQAAAGAEFQNALRPAAADDFPQEKPPLEIRRIVAPGVFSQTGQPPNLENAGFFCAVIKITQPGGENSSRDSHNEG